MTETRQSYSAIPHRVTFADALSLEIFVYIADARDITSADVADMLTRAAAAVVDGGDISPNLLTITLRREYAPDDNLACRTVIDFGDGDIMRLWTEDIALLRALLLAWDENRPAQVGDPLDTPTRLADGRITSEVTSEMLE